MGAVVSYDLEKARLKRGYRHADGKTDQERDCLRRSQASILAFEASRERDDLSCEAGALEGHLARETLEFLHDCNRVGTQAVSGYMRLWSTGIDLLDASIKYGTKLLHRYSLSSSPTMELDREKFPAAFGENVPRTEARREP
jgi:hypothetical protein